MRHRWMALALVAALAATTVYATRESRAQSAAPAGGKVYVGLFKDDAVAVVDPGAGRVLAKIAVPRGPHGLVITPDGRKVYVSSDGDSTVSVIDTATDRVARTIDVGPNPHGLAISRDGRAVLVSAFGANEALVVDTAGDVITARVPVPQPHNAAFSPDGRTAYVGSQKQGATAVVVLDLVEKKEIGRIALDKTPRALDVSPDGAWLYFTVAGDNAVQVYDTKTRQLAGTIPVGASPHIAVFTNDGRASLAVSQGPSELTVIDPARRAIARVVKVGTTPHWVAASADGRTAFVANEMSNDVSVVDIASGAVTATIPVGQAPRKIAAQPGAGAKAAAPAPAPVAAASVKMLRLGNATFADHGTHSVTGQKAFEIEADDYYFKPTFLRGVPGQRLTLEVENESGTLHNISIPSLKIDRDVPPKKTVKVDVVFPASGVITFACKFHSALGMNGQMLAGDAMPQAVVGASR